MTRLTCFKSYDIRGALDENLDAEIVYRVGRAFALHMNPGTVVVGRDIRASSDELAEALMKGLQDQGADVLDIGLCGTEEVYFATDHLSAGGGLMVTASHNPINYNGIKVVQAGSKPMAWATGLSDIHDLAAANVFETPAKVGTITQVDPRAEYVERVLSFADVTAFSPLKILVNGGNGAAGPTFDALADAMSAAGSKVEFVRLHHEPDSTFPNGIPNPLLLENQPVTGEAVLAHGADLGVAWDGDFDRCFFFDETGAFIEGEYVVALLTRAFLLKQPGASIVHDPRVIWSVEDTIAACGGVDVLAQTGHALIKAKMREVDAIYGGELSAHHYFRNFMYCDSGMIPWLLVAELMSSSGKPLSALVGDLRTAVPTSGEINFKLPDPKAARDAFQAKYVADAVSVDELDGLSVAYADWRANLRMSNTEPLLRLNVEARANPALLAQKVEEISALISSFAD